MIYIDSQFVLNPNMLVKLWKQKGLYTAGLLVCTETLSSPNNFTRMYGFVFSVKPLEYKVHPVI